MQFKLYFVDEIDIIEEPPMAVRPDSLHKVYKNSITSTMST